MAYTARYSSIWDRWRGDESGLSLAAWEAWLSINNPNAIARNEYGGYIDHNGNPRSWQLTPFTLAEVVWLYIRGEVPGATQAEKNAEVQRMFSFSEHELLQMADVKNHITSTGSLTNQMARWKDFLCWMDMVEQRAVINKQFVYSKFGIRDDVASG